MARRIKRTQDYELVLELKTDTFIRPPREAQRNWLLNRSMKEFGDELVHLDTISGDFVRGAEVTQISDREQGDLHDSEIMEDWQIPIMRAMAESAVRRNDRVLEIGFGRGIASSLIQEQAPSAHTIIECNDSVVDRFHIWRENFADREISIIHSLWQDAVDSIGPFDSVFFHTYPLNNEDFAEQVASSSTFAEHFFDTAHRLLVDGGRFTYLTSELDSLSRPHQRALLSRYSRFSTSVVGGLKIPDDTHDATWGDSMIVVCAER